jgi:hypothetical protein
MTALPSIYEPIMNALLALLQAQLTPGLFRTVTRRYIPWEALMISLQNNTQPFPQPCLILYDGVGFGGGTTKFEQRGRGRPTVRVVSRTIVIYAQMPGGGTAEGTDAFTPGGAVFGPLSEAIEGVFQLVDSENALTLGGLVSHCWIEGESHWATGDIDPYGQGLMTVPVKIMLP